MSQIRQILIVSRLVRGSSLQDVVRIISVSRRNNHRDGVTGVLYFNGEYFCALLEGEPLRMEALAGAIVADPRHHDVKVLLDRQLDGPRLFTDWRVGFAYNGVEPLLVRLCNLRGETALEEFRRIQAMGEFELL